MGELFGLSSAVPVSVSLNFLSEHSHGRFRESGWGVSVLDGGAALTLKQPTPRPEGTMAEFVASGDLRGDLVLAYIRRWAGEPRLSNCHPFVRELNGREWVFAHNGDVTALRSDPQLRARRFRPIGSTDSELAFCVLLETLAALPDGPPETQAEALLATSTSIAAHGTFNYLLAAQGCLFAYSSGEYGLYALRFASLAEPSELGDEDWRIRVAGRNSPAPVVVVASNPMSPDTGWRRLHPGELLVTVRGAPCKSAV